MICFLRLTTNKGPLAKVWLAAHERKLTKAQLLETNIERSVKDIVDQDAAPLALRLSGQLLLGVVRIYSRKTGYLYDDCNEALTVIKKIFKPGNVDAAEAAVTVARRSVVHANNLLLQETVTDMDLLVPQMDFDFNLHLGKELMMPDNVLENSIEMGMGVQDPLTQLLGDENYAEVELDLPLDNIDEQSVELGRDAPAPRRLSEGDFTLDKDVDVLPPQPAEYDNIVDFGPDDYGFDNAPVPDFEPIVADRMSQIPETRLSLSRQGTPLDTPARSLSARPISRVMRRATANNDSVTEISSAQLTAQIQHTPDTILQPRSLNTFSVLAPDQDWRARFHPSVRNLVSLDFVRQIATSAQKRPLNEDGATADVEQGKLTPANKRFRTATPADVHDAQPANDEYYYDDAPRDVGFDDGPMEGMTVRPSQEPEEQQQPGNSSFAVDRQYLLILFSANSRGRRCS